MKNSELNQMLQSPQNKLIIKCKTKYVSNITSLLKLSAIQNATTIDPADYVAISGEVMSLPKTVTNRLGLDGFTTDDIRVGDTAIFSHMVIYDLFIPAEGEDPIYRNRLWYRGEEYFLADVSLIHAVIRDGQIIMVNGFVMLRPFQESKIILAASSKKTKGTVKCQVMYIGNPRKGKTSIDAKQGDWVYFNPFIAQKYQINNKPFVIVQQHQILGMDVPA